MTPTRLGGTMAGRVTNRADRSTATMPEVYAGSGPPTVDRRAAGTRPATSIYRHPVNQMLFEAAPFGARVADRVTGFMGSWRFIVVQTILVTLWLGANVILLTRPFDPYPFILLNLAFSTQAAYAAPLILLAGNRASHRDRLTLEHAAAEGDLGDAQNERLLNGNTEILRQVAALEARILGMEQAILVATAHPGDAGRGRSDTAPRHARVPSGGGAGRDASPVMATGASPRAERGRHG